MTRMIPVSPLEEIYAVVRMLSSEGRTIGGSEGRPSQGPPRLVSVPLAEAVVRSTIPTLPAGSFIHLNSINFAHGYLTTPVVAGILGDFGRAVGAAAGIEPLTDQWFADPSSPEYRIRTSL